MENELKLGIVGSRRRNTQHDNLLLREYVDVYHAHCLEKGGELVLVSGGCPKGADRFAEEIARELDLKMVIHYPDESSLPEDPEYYHYVKMYHARNTLIAEGSDVILALVTKDRKGGTEDTIKKAERIGTQVRLL